MSMSEKDWSPSHEVPPHDAPLEAGISTGHRGKGRSFCKHPAWIGLIMFATIMVTILIATLVSKVSPFHSSSSTSTTTSGTAATVLTSVALSTSAISLALSSATSLTPVSTKSLTLSLSTGSATAVASPTFTAINVPALQIARSAAPPMCNSSNPPPSSAGKVTLAGVNIAGCEFGQNTQGNQLPASATCPLGPTYNRSDGPGQMIHFARKGFNTFRIPVGWQFLINNSRTASGDLNPTNFAKFDFLVQKCLATGAYCIIDIHNYARFSQGGPSDAIFAQLWTSLATQYKNEKNIIFGVMNEPHDIPSLALWGSTVQTVVTAIRNAGATSQVILIPGTDYSSALSLVSKSIPYLWNISNPDGTYTNLVFDIHKYIDANGSGTTPTCIDTQVTTNWMALTQWLRCHGRMALLTETGGGSTSSCDIYLCQLVDYLSANSDVYLGYLGWGAGSFSRIWCLDGSANSDPMFGAKNFSFSQQVKRYVNLPFTDGGGAEKRSSLKGNAENSLEEGN